jgi:hypothetical protein
MPYYVFAMRPPGLLDKRGEFAAFREASAHAKALRRELPPGAVERIRVMFGENQLAAEDQLLQLREAGPAEDD